MNKKLVILCYFIFILISNSSNSIFWECKNWRVSPILSNSDRIYDYEVEMNCSGMDNISLMVGPTVTGPWTNYGTKPYNHPGLWQIIKWDDINLAFSYSNLYYKFVSIENHGIESDVLEGPFWNLNPTFNSSTVSPREGFLNNNFQYNVNFKANKNLILKLYVIDPNSNEIRLIGSKDYVDSPNYQNMSWNVIHPYSGSNLSGQSHYYFGTYHDKTYILNSTDYLGPYITNFRIRNAYVFPYNGSRESTYYYIARIESMNETTPREVCLEIFNPQSNLWTPIESKLWTNNNLLMLEYMVNLLDSSQITFDGPYLGELKYRFVIDDRDISKNFTGPNIILNSRHPRFQQIDENTYGCPCQIEIRSLLNNISFDINYTTDNGNTWHMADMQKKYISSPNWQLLTWENNISFDRMTFDCLSSF